MNFRVIDVGQLPRCAWLLDFRPDAATLFKGPWVESADDWFSEGAWAGVYTPRAMLNSHFRCGSGATLDGSGLTVAPPSHSLEAIYCFSYSNLTRHLVSNSIACIQGAEPKARLSIRDFPAMRGRAASVKRGTKEYKRIIYQTDTGTMHRLAFAPFRLDATKGPIEIPGRHYPPPFVDFASYMAVLHSTAAAVAINADSPQRKHRFSRIVSSLSAGYDSSMLAVIAKALGGSEAVTLLTGRGGAEDSGRLISEHLGMQCHEYPRFATGIEQKEDKDFRVDLAVLNRHPIPEIDAFLGSLITTEDAVFAPFMIHLQGALFLTGFHGDKIWAKKTKPEPVIERGDNSGSGLDEVRKRIGFVHVPLAFVAAEHSRLIGEISHSADMAPYSVGGEYDRPIPRRVVESAGVPRNAFGVRKARGSVLFRFSTDQRYQFQIALADRYAAALREGVGGSAQDGDTVASPPLKREQAYRPTTRLNLNHLPQQHLFARGFILSEIPNVWAPAGWQTGRFLHWHLRRDPRLSLHYETRGTVEVLCLGLLFDVRAPESSSAQTVAALADALVASEDQFLELMAYTNGRHVVVYRCTDGKTFLITDATGMKSAFRYSREKRLLASHANLIAVNADDASSRRKIRFQKGYPGLRVPRENIFLVTPNTKLDLDTFEIIRYWPRRALESIRARAAADEVSMLMAGAFAHISDRFRPVISITAGIDSRTTLAVSRGSGAQYFTYYRNDETDTDILDREFGLMLSRSGLINHHLIDTADYSPIPPDYLEVLKQNSHYKHIPAASFAYLSLFGSDPRSIHVRSNLSEIGRQFYHSRLEKMQSRLTSARDLADLWLPRNTAFDAQGMRAIVDAFEEFEVVNKLIACGPWVDLPSLFYWEHRMGAWHSQVATESDPAFDTVSLYNCRRVLELLLSVSKEEQRAGLVLKETIRRLWPALMEFPLNGKPFWPAPKTALLQFDRLAVFDDFDQPHDIANIPKPI